MDKSLFYDVHQADHGRVDPLAYVQPRVGMNKI